MRLQLFNFIIMKIVLPFAALVIVCFASVKADNPLKNTKWRSNSLLFYFTASDTVKMFVEDQLVAAAQYKVKDSVLTWRDFPVSETYCDTSFVGTYIYKIKDDRLTFRFVYDKCDERANMVQTLDLTKQ
jgi:hypothetical protein